MMMPCYVLLHDTQRETVPKGLTSQSASLVLLLAFYTPTKEPSADIDKS
jgi:hypothetical protein